MATSSMQTSDCSGVDADANMLLLPLLRLHTGVELRHLDTGPAAVCAKAT